MVISSLKIFSIVSTILLLLTAIAVGGSFRDVDDKEIMNIVKEGVELIQSEGEEAFSVINKRESRFNKDNLLLSVYDSKVTLMAHPNLLIYIGKNFKGTHDVQGKKFRDEIVEKGLKGGGWTKYVYKDHKNHGLHFRKVYSNAVEHDGRKYIVAAETTVHEKTEEFLNEKKEHGHKDNHDDK